MSLKKKDFVEIDFTGRVKDGDVFDSTIKEDLEKLHQGHNHEVDAKPLIFCLGEGMFLESIDDFLIGKEMGKNYELELKPERAFGPRNAQLIQMIPLKIFREKNVNPQVGASLNFDGRMGKILSVSGGRVMVDFNHFLAGKTVEYKLKVLRKIDNIDEKVNSLNEFFFRKTFKHEIQGNKLILEVEKPLVRLAELFKDKFKEMLDLDLEIKEIPAQEKTKKEKSHSH